MASPLPAQPWIPHREPSPLAPQWILELHHLNQDEYGHKEPHSEDKPLIRVLTAAM